jgi:hypothetical protein
MAEALNSVDGYFFVRVVGRDDTTREMYIRGYPVGKMMVDCDTRRTFHMARVVSLVVNNTHFIINKHAYEKLTRALY